MKLKEFIKSNFTSNKVSNVGTNSFRLTLDRESVKTPHFIMQKVEDMISDRTSIQNGLKQLALFTMPDLKFVSTDEKSHVFANEWLAQRDSMERELFNFIYLFLGVGNSYLEPTYEKGKNGKKLLSMLETMPMPSTVYFNVNRQSDSCLLYTSPSPRDVEESRMPSSA